MADSVKIQPLAKQVLLQSVKQDDKTKGGIYIPPTAKEDSPMLAKVLAVGTSSKIAKRGVKVGDTVIYSKYSGTEVEYDGEKYILVSVDDILAKVNE